MRVVHRVESQGNVLSIYHHGYVKIETTPNHFGFQVYPEDLPGIIAALIETAGPEEMNNHLVRIDPDGSYTVQHPLIERVKGTLLDCNMLKLIVSYQPYVDSPGDYQAWISEGDLLNFKKVDA